MYVAIKDVEAMALFLFKEEEVPDSSSRESNVTGGTNLATEFYRSSGDHSPVQEDWMTLIHFWSGTLAQGAFALVSSTYFVGGYFKVNISLSRSPKNTD
ncbi:hypothetical protein Y032_0415g1074 [Ancylostoma ceylanicum]|uniref:Uncharacterized protein n=1 Tax=Ancylostoma ceylanicum TaxID=53326 RepID=A0A016X2T9_9BILA|nr:hypothetical protein Y032_0415g1074 [Ancylostoma ceylanicum]